MAHDSQIVRAKENFKLSHGACFNGIDKQDRPRSSSESDQVFLCSLFGHAYCEFQPWKPVEWESVWNFRTFTIFYNFYVAGQDLTTIETDPVWQAHLQYYEARTIIYNIGLTHFVLNFYIYLIAGDRFRREVMKTLKCRSAGRNLSKIYRSETTKMDSFYSSDTMWRLIKAPTDETPSWVLPLHNVWWDDTLSSWALHVHTSGGIVLF